MDQSTTHTTAQSTTESTATKKPNAFVRFWQNIGSHIKVVFVDAEKLLKNFPRVVKAGEDIEKDAQEVTAEVKAVVAAALAFSKPTASISAALAAGGSNLSLDAVAVESILADLPTLNSELQNFASAVRKLATTLNVDVKALIADLEGSQTTASTTQAS